MDSAFPNQVASGDTTQTSTVLWTRSTTPGAVTFEYATSSDFGNIQGAFSQTVTDPLLPVKQEVQNLLPGTQYFYRVTDANGNTASGQFKTAANPLTRAGLSFGVAGDWRGELSPYPAIRNAPALNLDFFVQHGDTVYADFASPDVPLPQARTLDEFRAKHNEVYSSRSGLNAFGDLRASTSILSTIDDHEVINDFAGGAPAASDPRLGTTTGLVNDTPLYETGIQAFQEYNPLRNDFYGNTGDPRTAGEQKLYRANTYGKDAAVFLLDARSFRDQELSPVTNPADSAQVSTFLARSFDVDPLTGQPTPRRTFLGNQQLEDVKRDLLQAEQGGVTWKFIMVPEPTQNLGVSAASDRYEGYAAERTELLKFIDDNRINNVVFVAADIHGTLVNNLTYQEGPGQPQKATNAFEITTGSVGFDAPLGPTLVNLAARLGLVPADQKAFYDALPVANDADSIANDKDDFVKQLINAQLAPLGYDPVGLNANLPAAQGLIDATLLQGDYVAGQTYGWTAFDIDPSTQKLTVTTYGIAPYTEAELKANPAEIAARQPQIVSQFAVNPKGNLSPSTSFAVNGAVASDTFTAGNLGTVPTAIPSQQNLIPNTIQSITGTAQPTQTPGAGNLGITSSILGDLSGGRSFNDEVTGAVNGSPITEVDPMLWTVQRQP
jgi:phosphodiesterase/alkaline phosphatase D-like protein